MSPLLIILAVIAVIILLGAGGYSYNAQLGPHYYGGFGGMGFILVIVVLILLFR